MNSNAATPSSPMVYLEIRPMPMEIPTPSHARALPPIRARSRKYNAAAQAAVNGASGVISSPDRKKNGSACVNATASSALVSPNTFRVRR